MLFFRSLMMIFVLRRLRHLNECPLRKAHTRDEPWGKVAIIQGRVCGEGDFPLLAPGLFSSHHHRRPPLQSLNLTIWHQNERAAFPHFAVRTARRVLNSRLL